MQFKLKFPPEAEVALTNLEQFNPKKHKKVLKMLGLIQTNILHPSLKTHKFEAYVENKTPEAF